MRDRSFKRDQTRILAVVTGTLSFLAFGSMPASAMAAANGESSAQVGLPSRETSPPSGSEQFAYEIGDAVRLGQSAWEIVGFERSGQELNVVIGVASDPGNRAQQRILSAREATALRPRIERGMHATLDFSKPGAGGDPLQTGAGRWRVVYVYDVYPNGRALVGPRPGAADAPSLTRPYLALPGPADAAEAASSGVQAGPAASGGTTRTEAVTVDFEWIARTSAKPPTFGSQAAYRRVLAREAPGFGPAPERWTAQAQGRFEELQAERERRLFMGENLAGAERVIEIPFASGSFVEVGRSRAVAVVRRDPAGGSVAYLLGRGRLSEAEANDGGLVAFDRATREIAIRLGSGERRFAFDELRFSPRFGALSAIACVGAVGAPD